MQLTPAQDQLLRVFSPFATARQEAILKNRTCFVHYTTAQAAVEILKTKEIWMRKSRCMNDYTEVQFGISCLAAAYKISKLKSALDNVFDGASQKIETQFDHLASVLLSDTYVTCFSEHSSHEDIHGRLSMWRAYSGATGIACVIHGEPFLNPSDPVSGAYSCPVEYSDGETLAIRLGSIADNICNNREFLLSQGQETLITWTLHMLRWMAVSIKHPGFSEEREWRVVYVSSLDKSDDLTREIVTINGEPQAVYKLPIRNISGLINRIIIGPTRYPRAIAEAFVELLGKAGVENPNQKVFMSEIPLRR